MSLTKYWIWLNLCQSLSERKTTALLDAFGSAEDIFGRSSRQLAQRVELSERQKAQLDDKDLAPAKGVMDYCVERGVRMLTVEDSAYPEALRHIECPPAVLYLRGRFPQWEEELFLAVVGTRHPSPYGVAATERLSGDLARSGFWIVSGMAEGIDSAAHRGALKAGGQTIAVLGCGVDICYPRENRRLMDDIAATGLIVSEFPPGARPEPHHFPRRNRIISGLASGVLVGEAPARSGALITAALALEQGKDVFAIPFPIDTPAGAGGNRLIRQGEAQLAASAWDIAAAYEGQLRQRLEELQQQGWQQSTAAPRPEDAPVGQPVTPAPDAPAQPPVFSALPEELSDLARQIVLAVEEGAGSVDEIQQRTQLSVAEILPELTVLEMDGLLTRQQGRLTRCPQS